MEHNQARFSFLVSNLRYQTRFFTTLTKVYNNMENSYPDVTLLSVEDGTKLKCHRVILSGCSDYFANVFSWSSSDVLEVHNGITSETIEVILKYIYSANISLTIENAKDVLAAANYFAIIELVDTCVTFLLQKLQLHSCINTLLNAWQFDVPELTAKLVSYVGKNFSCILQSSHLRKQLMSLPVQLMVELLKSDDLIIRDGTTKLLTFPPEREKLVLDIILDYTTNFDHSCDITALLSCVRWPILNIFGENGDREAEFKALYNVKHSKWFLSPPGHTSPTAHDKSMYGTRVFTCSELVASHPMGNKARYGGRLLPSLPSTSFSVIAKDNEHIAQLDVITLSTWGEKTIIGGLNIHFASPGKNAVCHHIGARRGDDFTIHKVALKKGEHIIGVGGRSGFSNIDSLTFETSNGRSFGPYGGFEGLDDDLMENINEYREEGGIYEQNYDDWDNETAGPHPRVPLDSIIVGVTGHIVTNLIADLSFIFRQALPSSNFLVNNEMRYEFFTPSCIENIVPPEPCDFDEYNIEELEDEPSHDIDYDEEEFL